MMSEERA